MFVQRHGFVHAKSIAVKANRAYVLLEDISRQIADGEFESFLVHRDDQRVRAEAELIAASIDHYRNGTAASVRKHGPGSIFRQGFASRHSDAQDILTQSGDLQEQISGLHFDSIGQRGHGRPAHKRV